jgi:transposase
MFSITTAASNQTVRNWLQRYLSGGLDRLLQFKRSPGRPAKLTKTQRQGLGEVRNAGPAATGFTGNCWRSPMIQQLIEQRFGVLYSVHYLSELLRSMGFTYQKASFVSAHLNEQVLNQTDRPILLIQDGARYHTSAAMKAFFAQYHDRLTVFQLPSYSPDFNPIEKLCH